MPEEQPNTSLDLLGVKGVGDAVKAATEGLVAGAGAFLSRICLPAAEEVGLLFRDRVNHWRATQAARITEKSKRVLESVSNSDQLHAHPRIVGSIIENGSWTDSNDVQEMWAGLLASACTEDGKDESNLIFVNLLSQLTATQARILAYGSEKVEKRMIQNRLIAISGRVFVTLDELFAITQVTDVGRIDRELDHLRALGLHTEESGIFGGIGYVAVPGGYVADVAPSALGLQMYVRCQGSRLSPAEYFGVTESEEEEPTPEQILDVAFGQPPAVEERG